MSKLSFRARALDATKPMPIYKKDELSDLQDYSVLNRAVPQMPSGMEKEEESEHHLQRAISAQQVYGDAKVMVIPVPEAEVSLDAYNGLYKKSFRLPKHYVHNQAQALNSILEQEKPDYDMDSEDERWVKDANKRVGIDVTADQFEEMIDRLEKSCGNQIVTLQEAKLLLKEDDDLIKAVYDYWTRKRLRNKGSLVFQVRQERRDGSSNNDSYVAFRRRTEKMQTRKNRKNDESSYEKMLKLRRELSRAVTILEMVKRREKSKRELLHLTLEIVEKRYQMKDWDEKCIRSVKKELHSQRARSLYRPLASASSAQYRKKRLLSTSFSKNKLPVNNTPSISRGELDRDIIPKKLKKKRQRIPLTVGMSLPTPAPLQPTKPVNDRTPTINKVPPVSTSITPATTATPKPPPPLSYQDVVDTMTQYEFPRSSDEDSKSPPTSGSSPTENFDPKRFPDGVFTFRRKPGCSYNAPGNDLIGDWSWMSDPKHRYSLTSLSVPDRCVGFARRRVGRGGRILLDRAHHPYSRQLEELDLGRAHDHLPPTLELQKIAEEIKENRWRHYTPTTAGLPRCQGNDSSSSELDPAQSWSSAQLGYDFGRDFSDSKSPPSHQHGVATKKRRQPNTSHKNPQGGDVVLGLDKSSIAFAVSALVTMPTTTPPTVTITTDATKSSRVSSSASQCRPASEVSRTSIPAMQKCVTCGGIVSLTSTLTDMRAGHAATSTATGQHRVLPVTLSLATTMHQSSGQRATVLPATMTVSMPKTGGGSQTPGVPAFLRISSSGAVVGGTVLYAGQQSPLVKSDDGSAAIKTKKDPVSVCSASSTPTHPRRTLGQRNAVNVNLALPTNVRINSESVGLRATQSAPNSPRSHPGHGGEGGNVVAVKSARSGANSKTISLNLSNLTNKQTPSNIPTSATPSGQVFSAGRITIANMMKRSGGGAFFSVAIPQSGKFSSSTPSTSSTTPASGDSTLSSGDGNVVIAKVDGGKPKARTKLPAEQQPNSRPDLKPVTLATLTKSGGGASSSDPGAVNHTVQINLSSPKPEPPSSTNILGTVATNTVPVKSSKPSRPMEVT